MENKIIDITGLGKYHKKLETDVLSKKQDNITDLETIRTGAAAGAVAEQNAKDYAKDYADGLASNYDAAGSAAAAQAAAEKKATDLNTDMDVRVKKLEEIDHEKLASDASAAAVAAIVAGAESDFDTLKEVAEWIASDTQGSAALQATVSGHTTSIGEINEELDALDANKQDAISDLETIRSGAEAGATALQADDLGFADDDDINGIFSL